MDKKADRLGELIKTISPIKKNNTSKIKIAAQIEDIYNAHEDVIFKLASIEEEALKAIQNLMNNMKDEQLLDAVLLDIGYTSEFAKFLCNIEKKEVENEVHTNN